MLVLAVLLAACVPAPEDCLQTYGDHCSCEPKCLTQRQVDAINDFCDLGCDDTVEWECTVEDGRCAVEPE